MTTVETDRTLAVFEDAKIIEGAFFSIHHSGNPLRGVEFSERKTGRFFAKFPSGKIIALKDLSYSKDLNRLIPIWDKVEVYVLRSNVAFSQEEIHRVHLEYCDRSYGHMKNRKVVSDNCKTVQEAAANATVKVIQELNKDKK